MITLKNIFSTRRQHLKNIIKLLYTIIDNPISMYYENLSCLATTYEEKSSFDLLDNIKEYSPEIRLRLII